MDDKYLDLLDAETLAFVRQTEAFYPVDAINATIEQQRGFYDALCDEFNEGYPPEVTHDSICAEFCARTGCSLTAVDYRLAPEFIHPVAYDDCLVAFNRITAEQTIPIILVGDSAGGTLAAAVAHTVRGEAQNLVGQLLIYPALGGDKSKGSYQEHANAPMLTLADIEFYGEIRGSGRDLSNDATATPLADRDFSNLPPTVIVTAECDPLADDGGAYRDVIQKAGGKALWFNETGLVHGYLRARFTVERIILDWDLSE